MKKSFKEIRDEFVQKSQTFNFDSSLGERRKFDFKHLEAAEDLLRSVDQKCRDKIDTVVDQASKRLDRKLFKKLNNNIWEFRINHQGIHYRLLAFWERKDVRPLVLMTHGFIKKTQKVSKNEIERAEKIRARYFNNPK